jgi:hypothetical protein
MDVDIAQTCPGQTVFVDEAKDVVRSRDEGSRTRLQIFQDLRLFGKCPRANSPKTKGCNSTSSFSRRLTSVGVPCRK